MRKGFMMDANKPQMEEFGKTIQVFMSRLLPIVAIVLILAGVDALVTKMVLKNTSPVVGGVLIFFGLMQLPVFLKLRAKTDEITMPMEGMNFGPPGTSPHPETPQSPAPDMVMTATPSPGAGPASGMVLAKFGYKKSSQVVGLFVTAGLFIVGFELIFLHKFYQGPVEGGLKIFAWAALVLGALGFLSGLKNLVIPKPAIILTDQGIGLAMVGFSSGGNMIPWSSVRSVRIAAGPNSGGKKDSLGIKLDPNFPAHGLLALAIKTGNGELVLPVSGLNGSAQEIVSQVEQLWKSYSTPSQDKTSSGFASIESKKPEHGPGKESL
jgi:hypothetical protein